MQIRFTPYSLSEDVSSVQGSKDVHSRVQPGCRRVVEEALGTLALPSARKANNLLNFVSTKAREFHSPTAFCRLAAIAALIAVLSASQVRAQCTGICGDANSDGSLSFTDVFALFPYFSTGDSSGLEMNCADVDDYAGVTARDLAFIVWDNYLAWSLDCQIDNGPFVPMTSQDYRLEYNSVFPAGDTSVTLYIDVTVGDFAQAIAIVVKVSVDGETPSIADASSEPSDGSSWELAAFNGSPVGNIPPGILMGAYVSFDFDMPGPGRHHLGRADLIMPATENTRTISMELAANPGSNITMIQDGVLGDPDAWTLNLAPWIVALTGDVNNDQSITASDIISLINYVFKNGPSPYPMGAAGDVNCTGSVTSSDVIGLVNFVFKGGIEPCDVASQCTLTAETWTCP